MEHQRAWRWWRARLGRPAGRPLLAALRARWPGLSAVGIGGAQMAAQGFDAWWPMEKLAVRGYLEVLPRLPELLRLRRQLGDRLLVEQPELFIGVDAPDFNFGLEARLRAGGIKTCTSSALDLGLAARKARQAEGRRRPCAVPVPVRARAAGRARHRRDLRGPSAGQRHPLQPDRAAAPGAGPGRRRTRGGLLPGSRAAEIEHLAPRFFQAAAAGKRNMLLNS
jgi:lipid-A-disaccharide synthase